MGDRQRAYIISLAQKRRLVVADGNPLVEDGPVTPTAYPSNTPSGSSRSMFHTPRLLMFIAPAYNQAAPAGTMSASSSGVARIQWNPTYTQSNFPPFGSQHINEDPRGWPAAAQSWPGGGFFNAVSEAETITKSNVPAVAATPRAFGFNFQDSRATTNPYEQGYARLGLGSVNGRYVNGAAGAGFNSGLVAVGNNARKVHPGNVGFVRGGTGYMNHSQGHNGVKATGTTMIFQGRPGRGSDRGLSAEVKQSLYTYLAMTIIKHENMLRYGPRESGAANI
ncbi:hypothetical protein RUND412_004092 [Rhizina undulata]